MIIDPRQQLRIASKRFLQSSTIGSKEVFRKLTRHLCDSKLLLPSELKALDENTLAFPMALSDFQKIIMQLKEAPQLVRLLSDPETLREAISYFKNSSLPNNSNTELLKVLESIIPKKNNTQLSEEKQEKQVTQQEQQPIDALLEYTWEDTDSTTGSVLKPEQYQQDKFVQIEKHYESIRVREVHYRKQPVKEISFKDGVTRQLGFDVRTEVPVEVIRVPKTYNLFQEYENLLNTFIAYKQLCFSRYFPKYLGYNCHSEPSQNQYFVQYIETRSISYYLQLAKAKLHENSTLLQFWMRELFYAFRSILTMTTHTPLLPVSLEGVHVSEDGCRVFLKGVQFGRQRQSPQEVYDQLEKRLLRNFATVYLQILDVKEAEVDSKLKSVNLRYFTKILLGQHRNQHPKSNNQRVTFDEIARLYPMFDEKNSSSLGLRQVKQSFRSLIK